MMEKELDKILDTCITELRRGKSLEECLSLYPEQQQDLKPLLELAQEIQRLPKPEPAPEMVSATLVSVGEMISRHRKPEGRRFWGALFHQPRLVWVLSVSLILLFAVTGMTFIAGGSIPGDILYPVKSASEKVKFLLTFDAEKKAELRLTFSDERLRELTEVLHRSGTVDTKLLDVMLDEAKLALEDANELPEREASLFHMKFNHVNAFQKESLEHIRLKVPPSERETMDKAIEVCGNRMRWMMKRMREGRQIPWERGCDMR